MESEFKSSKALISELLNLFVFFFSLLALEDMIVTLPDKNVGAFLRFCHLKGSD